MGRPRMHAAPTGLLMTPLLAPFLAPLLACLLILLPAAAARAGDRALLVGIASYGGDSNLNGPRNDVEIVRRALTERLGFAKDAVLILPEEQSTKTGIATAFRDWLIRPTRPGDRVFFYYSGHGTQVPDLDHDEEDGKDEALVMIDIAQQRSRAGLLTDDEMDLLLSHLPGRQVTVVIDSCFSGTIERSLSLDPGAEPHARWYIAPAEILAEGPPRAAGAATPRERAVMRADAGMSERMPGPELEVWSASAAYQPSYETPLDGRWNGVFTRALVAALFAPGADANGNGRLSRSEVLAGVQAEARRFCEKSASCRKNGLTPTLTVTPEFRALGIAAWPEPVPEPAPDPAPAPAPAVQVATADPQAPPPADPAPVAPVLEAPARPPASVLPAAEATPLPAPVPAPVPALAPPDSEEMLDILTGGGTPAQLNMVHARPGKQGPVRAGDRVAFEIVSPEGGQVILFDLRDGGVVHQLFPSDRMGRPAPVTADRPLVVPDAYSGIEFLLPPGRGILVAVVVQDPGLIDDLARKNTDMTAISDPRREFGQLMERLSGVWQGEEENRSVKFGIAHLRYDAR